MPSTKRIDGDYQITTLNNDDNVIISTNTVVVDGNLDVDGLSEFTGNVAITGNLAVTGNITYINVTELNVTDPFILVNASNTGSYSANSGLLTHITSNTYAGIRYSSTQDVWELSLSTDTQGTAGTWLPIVAGEVLTQAAGNITEIQFNGGVSGNIDKSLAASANFKYDAANLQLTLNSAMVYGNIGNAPAAVANSVAVYHKQATDGGSGLYVKSTTTDSELVTNQTAILLSIIF
jgi:hypothetical protein